MHDFGSVRVKTNLSFPW
uniref:Uncharacterized protein n=1 Tax=Arundo donax TaxID=35708 RepID=A0A0A8YWA9_ARUDO